MSLCLIVSYNHTLDQSPGAPNDQNFDEWENENLASNPDLGNGINNAGYNKLRDKWTCFTEPIINELHSQLVSHFNKYEVPFSSDKN